MPYKGYAQDLGLHRSGVGHTGFIGFVAHGLQEDAGSLFGFVI